MEEINMILEEAEDGMSNSISHLITELSKIRQVEQIHQC
jgi:hypothetical protein